MKNEILFTYDIYAQDVISGRITACEAIQLACKRYEDFKLRDDMYFDHEDVQKKIKVVAKLKHSTGSHNGKPFILLPWQQWCVANIFGFKWKSTGLRVTRNVFIMMSRKMGKALALDTLIPTPDGWTTMEDIEVGDTILGADGNPTKVTYVTPVMYNHDCYEVTFSDGEKIVADADHNWFVRKRRKNEETVVTTKEMAPNYIYTRNNGVVNYEYRVRLCDPVELPERDLPLDPYILGLWLGDGTINKPEFTAWREDLEMYEYVKNKYGFWKLYEYPGRPSTYKVIFTHERGKVYHEGLRYDLDACGVLHNKHIPFEYLRASKEQRLALLQGLMDTDGCCTKGKYPWCEFVQKRSNVTDGFCELLSSLGIRYSRREKSVNGHSYYSVKFYCDKSMPCFRLKRKYDLLPDKVSDKQNWKAITSIKKVDSVPVRCLTVDNADHLYLCGERYTVTHNTAFASALSILCAIADKEAGAEIELVANSRQQAKIAFSHTSNFCESVDPKKKIFKRYRDSVKIPKTKSVIQVLSSDSMGLDGYNASCFVLDEFHAAKDWSLYNVLVSSQGMRDQPLAIIITTAGFLLNGYPCYDQRETCMDILRGLKTDDTQFSAIYELDPEDNWKDESVWIKAAPSLGQTVKVDYLRQQVNAVTNNPSLEVGVKTKNFNMFCQSKDVWLDNKYLKGVWAKVDIDDFKDEESYIGVDLSSVSDLTCTTIMFPPNPEREKWADKYVFKNFIYIPDENISESVNEQMYLLWKKQGHLLVTSGNVVDYDFILADQLKMYQTTYVNGIFYDSWNASSWAVDATAEGLPLYPYSQATGNFNRPTKTFEMLVRQGKVIIDYNPCVRWCFNNVELKRDQNSNCKPVKAGNVQSKKIDPIISTLEALGGYLNMNMEGGTSDGMVYNA